ncbi:MAG: MFS transporter [Holosporales bacterium]
MQVFAQSAQILRTFRSSISALRLAIVIWFCGALFYFYKGMVVVSPSIMTEDLMRAFGVNGFALGVLAAWYYNAYAAMQIPLGIIMDRFGPKRVLVFSASLCSIGCFLFSSAPSIEQASLGRLLMGAGSACAYIGTLKLITLWFPPHMNARMIGLTMVMGTLGTTTGGRPLALLIENMGWRSGVMVMAAIGSTIALMIYFFVRDEQAPRSEIEHTYDQGGPQRKLTDGLKYVVRSVPTWLISCYKLLMYVPLAAFSELWGVPYLMELYKIDRADAAWMISFTFMGIAIFSPITAALSDFIRSRKIPMIAGAVAAFIIYMMIIYIPNIPQSMMYVLLFVAGIAFTGQVIGFVSICEIMPIWASGVSLGVANMTVMLSGVIFEPLIGKLLDVVWNGTITNGIRDYTLSNYHVALSVIPMALFASIAVIYFVPETFKRHGQTVPSTPKDTA